MKLLRIIICIIVLFSGGCSEIHNIINDEQEEAKQTIINYIKACNDNNYDEQLRYLSRWKVNEFEQNRVRWNMIPQYEYIRVVKITTDDLEKSKDGYLKHGRGLITKPSKLVVFNVDIEFKLISDGVDPNIDKSVSTIPGKWKYFLIEESDTETWKIDDWGY